MGHPLPLTGERTVPGVPGEQYWFSRHEAAYQWVVTHLGADLVGAHVLEAGSGEGYGAELLRLAGATVVALEYDIAASGHSHLAYPGVSSVRANLGFLPVASGSVDVLATLQVVEHLWDLSGFLSQCHRALRTAGSLVVTTPNRPVFSPGLARGQHPTNPFHVEEFDATQLRELLLMLGLSTYKCWGCTMVHASSSGRHAAGESWRHRWLP